jgi:hypothetical protein
MKSKTLLKILYGHSASHLELNFNSWVEKENITIISTSYIINSGYHLSVVYTEN